MPLPSHLLRSGQKGFAYAAEERVAEYLAASGWSILAKNFRRKGTEIDIVAFKGVTLCFVEVKFRTKPANSPLINFSKREALKRGAQAFIAEFFSQARGLTIRFDLAIVVGDPAGPCQYFTNIEI